MPPWDRPPGSESSGHGRSVSLIHSSFELLHWGVRVGKRETRFLCFFIFAKRIYFIPLPLYGAVIGQEIHFFARARLWIFVANHSAVFTLEHQTTEFRQTTVYTVRLLTVVPPRRKACVTGGKKVTHVGRCGGARAAVTEGVAGERMIRVQGCCRARRQGRVPTEDH